MRRYCSRRILDCPAPCGWQACIPTCFAGNLGSCESTGAPSPYSCNPAVGTATHCVNVTSCGSYYVYYLSAVLGCTGGNNLGFCTSSSSGVVYPPPPIPPPPIPPPSPQLPPPQATPLPMPPPSPTPTPPSSSIFSGNFFSVRTQDGLYWCSNVSLSVIWSSETPLGLCAWLQRSVWRLQANANLPGAGILGSTLGYFAIQQVSPSCSGCYVTHNNMLVFTDDLIFGGPQPYDVASDYGFSISIDANGFATFSNQYNNCVVGVLDGRLKICSPAPQWSIVVEAAP